ncbi:MAG: DUF4038 domain-containing protein [Tunicatimonas sp.]
MLRSAILASLTVALTTLAPAQVASQWERYQINLTSDASYDNPLYDIDSFGAILIAPSGRQLRVNGFWDGGTDWRMRVMPDEVGTWSYTTFCSDATNAGLHQQTGTFECQPSVRQYAIYQQGSITRSPGAYHLMHRDGTPFFFTACTAWNGGLKSTDEEWITYLQHRQDHHYNAIQLVLTQWRGADQNSRGEVAYEGSGRIQVNPSFFQHMDGKMDQINEYGLVAAPVVLWALQKSGGRELNPGYTLPDDEAVLLSRYMVARYGAHHVIWLLGGDGNYLEPYEQRWKYIGQQVFNDYHPGLVTLHPGGRSWIGDTYADQEWLDIITYQSSHSNQEGTVNWINRGPMATRWDQLPPRPLINMEPNYEEIPAYRSDGKIEARDVRNASYWSLFATPLAGITYGANGIWPWIRTGERILNHGSLGDSSPSTWRESIDLPGSLQIGYLSEFIQQFDWWALKPAPGKLANQPGNEEYRQFVSVVQDDSASLVLAYVPQKAVVQLYNSQRIQYRGRWFDPATAKYEEAKLTLKDGVLETTSPRDTDLVLVLKAVE